MVSHVKTFYEIKIRVHGLVHVCQAYRPSLDSLLAKKKKKSGYMKMYFY